MPPSIIYIYPPHSPTRRMPKSITMTTVVPTPWACRDCRKPAITYADNVVWCNECEKKLLDADRVDIARGEQRNTSSPNWTPIKT